jgi:hypothetical protein
MNKTTSINLFETTKYKGFLIDLELSHHPSPATNIPAEWRTSIWLWVTRLTRAPGTVFIHRLAPEDNGTFFFDWPTPSAWALADGTANRETLSPRAQLLMRENELLHLNSGMVYGV